MQLFAALLTSSKELELEMREKLLQWEVKTSPKILLVPQHSVFRFYREVDSISIWDQGTLPAPVHLNLIYPGWPRLLCSAAGSSWTVELWKGRWWTARSLNLWNGTSSDLQVTWKQRTVLMMKGFTWSLFFLLPCTHCTVPQKQSKWKWFLSRMGSIVT